MYFRIALVSLIIPLSACSDHIDNRHYSIYFAPYSDALDQQGRKAVQQAAEAAIHDYPVLPISVSGYAAPPDPGQNVDGLSGQRAQTVQQALIEDGVTPIRIVTRAKGITDPKMLPNVAVRRVDISIGP
jgi:OOP family OmpA-OmpF porin